MERIAVESNLTPIQELLQEQGYRVDALQPAEMVESNPKEYDVMVISGLEKDLMGIEDRVQNCPVINASGLTPEEVSNRVAQTVQRY